MTFFGACSIGHIFEIKNVQAVTKRRRGNGSAEYVNAPRDGGIVATTEKGNLIENYAMKNKKSWEASAA